jgi:endogenous inhibitor of DNA gyrase (YacG/DUF329 family)
MPAADAAPVCVLCRRHPAVPQWRPFCSERCQLQDLARWADGTYRVSGDRVSDADRDAEPIDHEPEKD